MTHEPAPRSAPSTFRGRGLVALLVLAAGLAACSAKTKVPGAVPAVDGGPSTTGDPAACSGGAGGTAPSPVWTCSGDAAYRATSTAFTSPTAAKLASALDELVYAYEARPLSIVLHQDGYSRLGAASATSPQGGAMVFSTPAPALIDLDETAEGFGNLTPQPEGILTLVDAKGPVTIALAEIRWRARPDDGCGSIWVSFDAIIPASEGATVLHLGGGSASIAALAGAPGTGLEGYPVHAWFLGESMAFDFTSLGLPVKCAANPCDPSGVDFPDTPSGLGSVDAGLAASDAGLTLIGHDAGTAAPTCTGGTTEACSHSLCGVGVELAVGCDDAPAPAPPFGCVAKVCAADPSCCSSGWSADCVALVPGLCSVDCGSNSGVCTVCYTDTLDHDGDGYAWTQGDCADCDPDINPGAYDFPGNGVDEDCSGAVDDQATTCDEGLALASGQASDFVSALDLCKTTTAAATGMNRTWGVISSKLVQADGSQAPSALSYGILAKYGPNNLPQLGSTMAAFSTGTARAVGDLGWVNPNRRTRRAAKAAPDRRTTRQASCSASACPPTRNRSAIDSTSSRPSTPSTCAPRSTTGTWRSCRQAISRPPRRRARATSPSTPRAARSASTSASSR